MFAIPDHLGQPRGATTSQPACITVTQLDRYLRIYTPDPATLRFLQHIAELTPDDRLSVTVGIETGRRLIQPLPLPTKGLSERVLRELRARHAEYDAHERETRFLRLTVLDTPCELDDVILSDDWRQCRDMPLLASPIIRNGVPVPLLVSTRCLMLLDGGRIHQSHWDSHITRTRDLQSVYAVNAFRAFQALEASKDGGVAGLSRHSVELVKQHVQWCCSERVRVTMAMFDANRTTAHTSKVVHLLFSAIASAGGLSADECAWLKHPDTGMAIILQVAVSLYIEWRSVHAADGWVLVAREFDALSELLHQPEPQVD